ncbi:MAG: hypothetical protein K6U04_07625 [Armatimonadetes bacterium]|nr:hypothetical protein [Armatimonadota bacterium]
MNSSPMTQGMTTREVRAEMVRPGAKVSDIAKRAGVTHSAVSQTIYQYEYSLYKGRRVRPPLQAPSAGEQARFGRTTPPDAVFPFLI